MSCGFIARINQVGKPNIMRVYRCENGIYLCGCHVCCATKSQFWKFYTMSQNHLKHYINDQRGCSRFHKISC